MDDFEADGRPRQRLAWWVWTLWNFAAAILIIILLAVMGMLAHLAWQIFWWGWGVM